MVLGPLPVVPLLAALPAVGTPPGWVGALMVVPPAGGRRLGPTAPCAAAPSPGTGSPSPGAAAGWRPASASRVLASLSGGAAGPGRMRFVGPFAPDVLVHAVTACGIGALLGAAVVSLQAWRAARARVDED